MLSLLSGGDFYDENFFDAYNKKYKTAKYSGLYKKLNFFNFYASRAVIKEKYFILLFSAKKILQLPR
jgi:hypothetical protein